MAMKRDFEKGEVEAARSVMLELMQLLNAYHDHIVLIGGSVPWVMFPTAEVPHVGTTDVDLAIDRETVQSPDLAMIETLLIQNNYKQSNDKAFIFHRTFEKNGKKYKIQVDLLTGGDSHSADELAQAVHGCELAFEEPVEIQTNGVFPDGLRISEQSGQAFRRNPATHFGRKRPPVSDQSGHIWRLVC